MISKQNNHARPNRKGQSSPSQIFVYLFSAIVAAMVLLYGYSVIQKMGKDNIQMQKMELKIGVENTVKEMAPDYGSVRKLKVKVPIIYKLVCFASSQCILGTTGTTCPREKFLGGINSYPLIADSVESNINKNMFLLPDGSESYDIGTIEVFDADGKTDLGFYCFKIINGNLNMYVEGRGRLARIYAVEQ